MVVGVRRWSRRREKFDRSTVPAVPLVALEVPLPTDDAPPVETAVPDPEALLPDPVVDPPLEPDPPEPDDPSGCVVSGGASIFAVAALDGAEALIPCCCVPGRSEITR